jgi:wyosine [tRNA(Phe)-imidazoG37] synthetase (radical SAM superfamily)
MNAEIFKYVYGPVPSRRLKRSLGVDLVPFKTCTYDCIYCQLGRTTEKTNLLKEYAPIERILAELKKKLALGPRPDYVTLSGSGEPTLHCRIGELIHQIKRVTPIPLAVLTNGSLLWSRCVQDALMEADLVLPSLDAGDERLFRYVNRPDELIQFETMVQGLREFNARFKKPVWLEVFLLAGVTGDQNVQAPGRE